MAGIVESGEHIYGIQLPIQTLTQRLRDPWEEQAQVADLRSNGNVVLGDDLTDAIEIKGHITSPSLVFL